jgi:DNA processing protein
MIETHALLSEGGAAIVMLCSQLGLSGEDPGDLAAFTLKEWNALARKIHDSDFKHPGGLLGLSAEVIAGRLMLAQSEADRIAKLLARGGTLALELEQLAASGIWCVTRVDDAYPVRLRNSLKHQAPPVLFGAGDLTILQKPAIAIIGSRNLDESGINFAERLGALCAQFSVAVVSGGARGTDRIAMQAALDAGGDAVGVLADNLVRSIRQPDVREFISDGRLVVLTPYRPDNGFSVGAAMGRNKIIYGAADYAAVVSSDYQKGGTWAGAVEALKADWCPVFVRSSADVGAGNRELINKGALPLDEAELESLGDITEWMKSRAGSRLKQAELLLTP